MCIQLKKAFLGFSEAVMLLCVTGCDAVLNPTGPDGELLINFHQNAVLPKVPLVSLLPEEERRASTYAESQVEVQLDTNDFILSVVGSGGASLYHGSFGAAPTKIITSPGTYTISAKSCEFYAPLYSSPQFGDTKTAVVTAGKECRVLLDCEQMNCGIRLKIDPQFLTDFPNGVLFLKSSEGKLMYAYSEKRIAYFRPGNISLVLSDSGKERTLATYKVEAKEILTIKLEISGTSAPSVTSGIHIQLDTARVWRDDRIVIDAGGGVSGGGSNNGDEKDNALNISQAKDMIGATDVWVCGFIVGGDLSSSKCSFDIPFSSKTNLVLASKSSCRDKEACLSVQLNTGRIRDALNLVENPGLLGRKVYLKGDIVESYYGIPGIQSISEYSF